VRGFSASDGYPVNPSVAVPLNVPGLRMLPLGGSRGIAKTRSGMCPPEMPWSARNDHRNLPISANRGVSSLSPHELAPLPFSSPRPNPLNPCLSEPPVLSVRSHQRRPLALDLTFYQNEHTPSHYSDLLDDGVMRQNLPCLDTLPTHEAPNPS
jgi:hypothetical protein